jgi:hypothetical protein
VLIFLIKMHNSFLMDLLKGAYFEINSYLYKIVLIVLVNNLGIDDIASIIH